MNEVAKSTNCRMETNGALIQDNLGEFNEVTIYSRVVRTEENQEG